tara:strand:- start:1047 stop:1457 length:411 start_codon:yes stop_codon:yes gene_type:complete
MVHTRQETIKDLKEENEKLKEENEKLKEEIDGDTFWGISIGLKKEKSNLIIQQRRMVKEIVKLKEEIKELKEEVEEWKEVAEDYWLETPSQLESWMSASIHEDEEEYSKYMEPLELRDEVKKLKEENEKLKVNLPH